MPNPRWYLHGGVCATAVTSLVGLATEETLALADLITVEHDVVPYIMDWPQIPADDGKSEAAVLVVLKRSGGFMAAVPIGFMPEEVLANGNMDPPPGVVGPSTVLRLPGMVIENGVLTPHWISHVGRCNRSERECDWEPSTRRCQRGLSLHPRHQAAFCNPSSSLAYNLGSKVGRGQWGDVTQGVFFRRRRHRRWSRDGSRGFSRRPTCDTKASRPHAEEQRFLRMGQSGLHLAQSGLRSPLWRPLWSSC